MLPVLPVLLGMRVVCVLVDGACELVKVDDVLGKLREVALVDMIAVEVI